jgi:hypothetical protein
MLVNRKQVLLSGLILLILIVATCAPNNERFDEKPAGFWAGIWHGLICWITFIISLFTDSVSIYEVNNSGGWYNFGFLIGATCILSGSGGVGKSCKKKKSWKEKEWEEIGTKVEEKVRTGIKSWLDESEHKDKDWEEIGKKIEEKIKRELRKWAEK